MQILAGPGDSTQLKTSALLHAPKLLAHRLLVSPGTSNASAHQASNEVREGQALIDCQMLGIGQKIGRQADRHVLGWLGTG